MAGRAVDLVVFDMDGVLVDSEPISCRITAESLTRAGYPISAEEVRNRFLGISTPDMMRAVEAALARPLPPHFRERLRDSLLAAFERELAPMPGIAALLDWLPARYCVASSSHPERIRRSLEITGLYDRFAPHLFSSSMVARGKPAPDLFLHAAVVMDTAPARTVVVEDSEAGVRAGRAAGMTVIGFTGGGHVDTADHAPRLLACGADHVARDMAALRAILETLLTG
ncbi:HAD family hydrolase [Benzoatithermus flavus]|uniref:HAD family hydrolase n=1 Tax=Benzoatithermus flavus TaxID=3108223 RepID=A0ABU8XU73_9PROT